LGAGVQALVGASDAASGAAGAGVAAAGRAGATAGAGFAAAGRGAGLRGAAVRAAPGFLRGAARRADDFVRLAGLRTALIDLRAPFFSFLLLAFDFDLTDVDFLLAAFFFFFAMRRPRWAVLRAHATPSEAGGRLCAAYRPRTTPGPLRPLVLLKAAEFCAR
jgi:hypothetical protein